MFDVAQYSTRNVVISVGLSFIVAWGLLIASVSGVQNSCDFFSMQFPSFDQRTVFWALHGLKIPLSGRLYACDDVGASAPTQPQAFHKPFLFPGPVQVLEQPAGGLNPGANHAGRRAAVPRLLARPDADITAGSDSGGRFLGDLEKVGLGLGRTGRPGKWGLECLTRVAVSIYAQVERLDGLKVRVSH